MAAPTINLESFPWEYDVFLSFKGEDTGKTFTDHLYSALRQAGIRTFRDEEELRKGEYLAPELMRAIESSKISMIVLSNDYASSRWCLDELVQILECKEKRKQKVLPVFYDIDPSEVRKQSGNYGVAFAKHEERFGASKVQNWRNALAKIGDIKGWDLRNGYESKFIHAIVKEIQLVVKQVPIFVAKHQVGLDSRVEHVVQLLLGELDVGVRMIGIYGMGGIGKTTVAKAVYNRLLEHFESSCFLEIESAITEQQNNGINLKGVNNKIKEVQKMLFRKLFNEKIEVGSKDEGIMLLQKRLQAKKCLIVLDNLEHIDQFNALCGERDWFGKGSILILTTREAHLLKKLKEEEHYEAKVLNHEDSKQLFSLHVFGDLAVPKDDYIEVLDGIVAYCGGLPLALELLGSYLSDKMKEEWISTFEKLKKIPYGDIQAKLRISYDGLPDDRTKSLFLDLVCFSGGISKETAINMSESMEYSSTIEIRHLVDKCLIKCYDSHISMHNLIQDMGREVVRLEAPKNPGKRSRLWSSSDIHNMLKRHKGTENIEVIVPNSPMENMRYNTKAFKNMGNLRFLQIDDVHLDGNFKNLFKGLGSLLCLHWNRCPLKYITSNWYFENLVSLEMKESNIKEFRAPLKYFPCLKSLNLTSSKHLTKTPKFSSARNLQRLSFRGCTSLVKVHSSIRELGRLVHLDFSNCTKLKKFPELPPTLMEIGLDGCENLEMLPNFPLNLKEIHLYHCKNLEMLPDFPPNINNIALHCCKNLKMLPEFPPNIGAISLFQCKSLEMLPKLPLNLKQICLSGCKNLEILPEFPPNICRIRLDDCKKLEMLPEFPPNICEILSDGCKNLEMLPKLPLNLKEFHLGRCENLEMLPEFPPNICSIRLYDCKNLKILPEFPCNIRAISLEDCKSLEMLPKLPLNLKDIFLYGCENLKMLPEFPPNICKMQLHDCKNLKMLPEFPPGIDATLLFGFKNLEMLPKLPLNLKKIHLSGCENLEMLPKFPPNICSIHLKDCKNLKMLPEFPLNIGEIWLHGCKNLEILPEFPPNICRIELQDCKNLEMLPKLPLSLKGIWLDGCKNLKMIPNFPPNIVTIHLNDCKNLKMLPKLPSNLEYLEAGGCELMESLANLSNNTSLRRLNLRGWRIKLMQIQGLENLHFLEMMDLRGVSRTHFSKSLKVLIGSMFNCGSKLKHFSFQCIFTGDEIPRWIRCQEEGSSISFQWPLCTTLRFLGFFVWLVFEPTLEILDSPCVAFEIDGVENMLQGGVTCVRNPEVEVISLIQFVTRDQLASRFPDIKAGAVFKVTYIRDAVQKIGVVALYQGTDGSNQFVPLRKTKGNTKKRKRNFQSQI